MLLGIVAKPLRRDKFEVTPDNVAYLTALVAISEEVRVRCHVKHALPPRWQTMAESGGVLLLPHETGLHEIHVSLLHKHLSYIG